MSPGNADALATQAIPNRESYLSLLRSHRGPLSFGALLMALSSFGQTYFVALFGPAMRGTFHLSDGALGATYAAGTMMSAVTLGWVGRWIDRTPLRRYALATALVLATACLVTAASPNVGVLVLGFYLLRLGGQGLMTHTALTATARAFPRDAGKAIGIVTLGLVVGQALLPPVAVYLIDAVGWRWTWCLNGAIVILGTLTAVSLLPKRPEGGGSVRTTNLMAVVDIPLWRDRRMWLSLPALLASPFIATGFFFHQARLAEEKGWTLGWVAGWFSVFALTQAAVQVMAGPVIDRVGPKRLLPVCLLPQAVGMMTLFLSNGPWVAPVYLILTGASAAVASTLATALWVALYGPAQLGRVRAAVTAGVVVASGASPVIMGLLVDRGVPLSTQAGACAAYILIASLIATRT